MKKRILFVDDETKVLDGLRRMLYSRRDRWDVRFAEGGHRALALLEHEAFDVIVTDMRMPEMDGAELLRRVIAMRPDLARLILSGQCDQATVLRAVGPAHQFLTKPCDAAVLQDTIDRVCQSRQALTDNSAAVRAAAVQALFSPPKLIERLAELLKRGDTKAAGALVSEDIALSAKVLQLVSSSFFGSPQRTADAAHAVDLLGGEVLSALIALPEGFAAPAPEPYVPQVERINREALRDARAAADAARQRRATPAEVSHVFTSRLLQRIGSLLALMIQQQPPSIGCGVLHTNRSSDGRWATSAASHLLALWGIKVQVSTEAEGGESLDAASIESPSSDQAITAVCACDRTAAAEIAPLPMSDSGNPLAPSTSFVKH